MYDNTTLHLVYNFRCQFKRIQLTNVYKIQHAKLAYTPLLKYTRIRQVGE